jgi:hypothetical protein
LDGDFAPSSISDKCGQISYECSQDEVPEIVTTTLLDDSTYPSRAESPLSTRFKKGTLGNGLAEDSSIQPHVARKQEALENAQSEQNEKIREIGYDTCFGTVSSLQGKVKNLGIL